MNVEIQIDTGCWLWIVVVKSLVVEIQAVELVPACLSSVYLGLFVGC